MWDELDEPLGFVSRAAAPAGRILLTGSVVTGAALVATAIGIFSLPRRNLPLNSEPFALAKVEVLPTPRKPRGPDVAPTVDEAIAPSTASTKQVEAASGVKVTRGSGGPPKPLIIDVAQALGVKLTPAPDARLIEKSKYGLLPRIGVDGTRPIDVYARALDPRLRGGSPRIALVVGGFGLSAESAIAKLPGAVTLALTPTDAAVEQQGAQAREAGHETVLQAPMEDFSDSTSGLRSRILRTSASDVENLDSLRWQMGRFTGYVAVVNSLGGKFTPDRQNMSPILKEIAARGLGYLDDGSSPRRVAPDVAAALAMPSARGDVVIDANPAPEGIDAALTRLIELARQRGSAIGVASATPSSVERLARWTNGLESKGVALVPLSALMSASPEPSVQSNPSANP
ncbi:MAG TPA: divergent polysaccharide deacetylase family protein [Roseiarcus sp.]|nr:divergent polysaccharide deacetylase family protein [Roseiarcus sp.]